VLAGPPQAGPALRLRCFAGTLAHARRGRR
jgi:hypothetical protein